MTAVRPEDGNATRRIGWPFRGPKRVQSLTVSSLPSILFLQETFEFLMCAIRRDPDLGPDEETGVALIGRIEGEGPARRMVVGGVIEAGDLLCISSPPG